MANILVVGKYYPPYLGGTETNTRDVCEALANTHSVTAVVYNRERKHVEQTLDGVRVIRCATQATYKGQPIALSLFRYIDLNEIDLVHFHAPNFFANAVLLLKMLSTRKHKIPVVITHHMEVYGRRWLRGIVMPLYRALVKRSALVIVTSKKNSILSKDLPRNAPTIAIPLGLSPNDYSLTPDARAEAIAWKELKIGKSQSVCFIGRHVRYKGLDVLLRALLELPNVHGFIAGDGPLRKGIEALASNLGIGNRVHFLGYLSEADKKKMLAASDVFVMPSTEITEAFGISQLEAMAIGTPVVTSDIPTGVTDVALDQRTALLAPCGDVKALSACIRRLLQDHELAKRLADTAYEHFLSNFTNEHVIMQTKQVIERCLTSNVRVESCLSEGRSQSLPTKTDRDRPGQ